MVVVRGRLTPEAGALSAARLEAGREALYQKALRARAPGRGAGAGGSAPDHGPAAGGRAGADGGDRHCTTPSIPARRASATRLSSTSTRRCWPIQSSRASPLSRTAPTFPRETSRRLACDASRIVMRHDKRGRVVEIGARTRTIPPALRRALQHRDRGCRFPGCGVRVAEGHHLRHWAQGGPTTLSNSRAALRRHHRAVHEEATRRRAGQTGRSSSGGRTALLLVPACRLDARRIPSSRSGPVTTPRVFTSMRTRPTRLGRRAPRSGLGHRRAAPEGQSPVEMSLRRPSLK